MIFCKPAKECQMKTTKQSDTKQRILRLATLIFLSHSHVTTNLPYHVMWIAHIVTIFLLFIYTRLPHVGLSCHAFIMFSLSSFRSVSSPCFLSPHVYHSYFDACISYMLPTCLILTTCHASMAYLYINLSVDLACSLASL